MIRPSQALSQIPTGLRKPLLEEYSNIVQSYLERKWSPSELSGGRFCEIVYTILDGHAKGKYASKPTKPKDFVGACRTLEKNTGEPRSFQILIPRLLPALYEIRNNRGVGHAGGDVDPNHMDATAVISSCNWILAELIRVLHLLTIDEAQAVVDGIVERRIPLVWKQGDMRRVLDPALPLRDQLLMLMASSATEVSIDDLFKWSGSGNRGYFMQILRKLHSDRFVELSEDVKRVQLLPPGSAHVESIVSKLIQDAG